MASTAARRLGPMKTPACDRVACVRRFGVASAATSGAGGSPSGKGPNCRSPAPLPEQPHARATGRLPGFRLLVGYLCCWFGS